MPDSDAAPLDRKALGGELAAAVREAGALALQKFRSPLKSWTKGNASIVSEVDVAVDELLRDRLEREGWAGVGRAHSQVFAHLDRDGTTLSELARRVGVTLLVPGGMDTHFFDGRPEQYRPGPDAELADPADVAGAVVFALSQPPGFEIRELATMVSTEPSWP